VAEFPRSTHFAGEEPYDLSAVTEEGSKRHSCFGSSVSQLVRRSGAREKHREKCRQKERKQESSEATLQKFRSALRETG
jgi:hypothetical protein